MTKLNKQYMGVAGDGSPVVSFHELDKWTSSGAEITDTNVSAIQAVWNGPNDAYPNFIEGSVLEPTAYSYTYQLLRAGYEGLWRFNYTGQIEPGGEVYFVVTGHGRYTPGGSLLEIHTSDAITQPAIDPHNGDHYQFQTGDWEPSINNYRMPWIVTMASFDAAPHTFYSGTAVVQQEGDTKFIEVKIKHDPWHGGASRDYLDESTYEYGPHFSISCSIFTKLDGMTGVRDSWNHPSLGHQPLVTSSFDMVPLICLHPYPWNFDVSPVQASDGVAAITKGFTFKISPKFNDQYLGYNSVNNNNIEMRWKILNAPDNSTIEKQKWWVDAVLEHYPLIGLKSDNPKAHPDDPSQMDLSDDHNLEWRIKVRDELHPAVTFAPQIGCELYSNNVYIGTFPQDETQDGTPTFASYIEIPANQLTVESAFSLSVDGGAADTEAPFEIDEGSTGTITVTHKGVIPDTNAVWTPEVGDGDIGTDLTITNTDVYSWSESDSLDMTELTSTWTFTVTGNIGADEGDSEDDEVKTFSWGDVSQEFTIRDTFKSPSCDWSTSNSMYDSGTGRQYCFEERLESERFSYAPRVVFSGIWPTGQSLDNVYVVRELLPTGPGDVVHGGYISRAQTQSTTTAVRLRENAEGWPTASKWKERYKALPAADKEYANRYVLQFYERTNNDAIASFQDFLSSEVNAGQLGVDLEFYSYGVSTLEQTTETGFDTYKFAPESDSFKEVDWVFHIDKNPADTTSGFSSNINHLTGSPTTYWYQSHSDNTYGIQGLVQWRSPTSSDATWLNWDDTNSPSGVSLSFPSQGNPGTGEGWAGSGFSGIGYDWAKGFTIFYVEDGVNTDYSIGDPGIPNLTAAFFKVNLQFKFSIDNTISKNNQIRFAFVEDKTLQQSALEPVWLEFADVPVITEAEYSENDIGFFEPTDSDMLFHANVKSAFDLQFGVNYKTDNSTTEKTEFKIIQYASSDSGNSTNTVYVNRNVTDGYAPNGSTEDNVSGGQTYWQFWSVANPANQDRDDNWIGASDGSIWPNDTFWEILSPVYDTYEYKIEPGYENQGLIVNRPLYDNKTYTLQQYNNVTVSYDGTGIASGWEEGDTYSFTVNNYQSFPITASYQLTAGNTGVQTGSTNNVLVNPGGSTVFSFSMPEDSTDETTDRDGNIKIFANDVQKASVDYTATAEEATLVIVNPTVEIPTNGGYIPHPYGSDAPEISYSHPFYGTNTFYSNEVPVIRITNNSSESRQYKVELVRGNGSGLNNQFFSNPVTVWTYTGLEIGSGQYTDFDTWDFIKNTWWHPVTGGSAAQDRWSGSPDDPDGDEYRCWWRVTDIGGPSGPPPSSLGDPYVTFVPRTDGALPPLLFAVHYGLRLYCPQAYFVWVGDTEPTEEYLAHRRVQYLFKYIHDLDYTDAYEFVNYSDGFGSLGYGVTARVNEENWPVKVSSSNTYFVTPRNITKVSGGWWTEQRNAATSDIQVYGPWQISTAQWIGPTETISLHASWEVDDVMTEHLIRNIDLQYLSMSDNYNLDFIWLDTPLDIDEGETKSALAWTDYIPVAYTGTDAITSTGDYSDRFSISEFGSWSAPGITELIISGVSNDDVSDTVTARIGTKISSDYENDKSNSKFDLQIGDTSDPSPPAATYGVNGDLEGGGGPGQAVTAPIIYNFSQGVNPATQYDAIVHREFSSRQDAFYVGYTGMDGDMGNTNEPTFYKSGGSSTGYPFVWTNYLTGKFMVQISWLKTAMCNDLGMVLVNRDRSFDTSPTSTIPSNHPTWSWGSGSTWTNSPSNNGDWLLYWHNNCNTLHYGTQQYGPSKNQFTLSNAYAFGGTTGYTFTWIIDPVAQTTRMQITEALNDWDVASTKVHDDYVAFGGNANFPTLNKDWTLYLGDDSDYGHGPTRVYNIRLSPA